MLDRCAGRDLRARRNPLVVGLQLQTEHIIEDFQIAVAAALHRLRHDRLHLLCNNADIDLVAAIVAEALEVQAVVEMANEGDVVLE